MRSGRLSSTPSEKERGATWVARRGGEARLAAVLCHLLLAQAEAILLSELARRMEEVKEIAG